jgi:AraC family transcriptional regulator of adaptative response / methylphosphotriester-DNA alkyltransferase methyltransferase
MVQLTEDAMYQAIVANEQQFDGIFYYAVKTTGIVCRPSCKSKVPNSDNVTFFTKLEDAFCQGYRACKRCRPDLGLRYMPESEFVKLACDIMLREYVSPVLVRELPLRIGVSSSHFQRIFKKIVGKTPKQYLQQLRIGKAVELLDSSTMNILDICIASGFANLSSFYVAFRSETGLSPREYKASKIYNPTGV